MKILGIESSCDETAAALLEVKRGRFVLRSNVVASQVKIHAKTGGVVPEGAARNHILKIVPVIEKALGGVKPDVIAVTAGPGLVTSLLVGVETARTLAYLWKKPLVSVNHIEGHIIANWMEHSDIAFPALALVVSGGHTELNHMKSHGKYRLLGATRDDAAGEAFDKAAKIMGLGYPGGPEISRWAQKGRPGVFHLPRPMIDSGDDAFSFSGLKTAVLYLVERMKKEKKFTKKAIADICAEFESAVTDVLVAKTIRAAGRERVRSIVLGGGVVANRQLRAALGEAVTRTLPGVSYYYPSLGYCTDNAVMIALAGYFRAEKKLFTPWEKLSADPNWTLYGKTSA